MFALQENIKRMLAPETKPQAITAPATAYCRIYSRIHSGTGATIWPSKRQTLTVIVPEKTLSDSGDLNEP